MSVSIQQEHHRNGSSNTRARAQTFDIDSNRGSTSPQRAIRQTSDTSHPPALSQGSDKENRHVASRGQKRRSDGTTMSESTRPSSVGPSKRRHLEERSKRVSSQAVQQRELSERMDKQYYDPDQPEAERRENKKKIRDLGKHVYDNTSELLQPKNKGLIQVLETQDGLMKSVKQTSDATIDSRLLVTVADLSYKKINELTLGDSSTGVDVDEFVSKCIIFMKKGAEAEREREARDIDPSQPPSSTQTQRRRRRQTQAEEDEEGDAMDWDYLGRNAAFLANSRPCLSGFLLGPLSVQKKLRQPTQRRAREAKADQTQALRPVMLEDEDLQDKEDKPLAAQCTAIRKLLDKTARKGMDAWNEEYQDDMTDEEAQNLMRKHHITDIEGGVPLFDFVVNPKSFGQTVENLFYVSFLIKEGTAGLEFDSRGMPVLRAAELRPLSERHNLPRNQAVFTLDFDMWQEIIKSCGITESIIPHAQEKDFDDGTVDSGFGWEG